MTDGWHNTERGAAEGGVHFGDQFLEGILFRAEGA
jgi:hypothetical protein